MGEISERPPRLNDDDTEDDPTRVTALEDPTAIESSDETTLSSPPSSLRALGIAPSVASKPIPPRPPMAPIVEPDGDPTEAGAVVRLVSVEATPERHEHTMKMAVAPVAAPGPAPHEAPSFEEREAEAQADAEGEAEPPAQVPGLEPDARMRWLAFGALALVIVAIAGVAVGRMSAPRTEASAATSTAAPSTDVPPPQPAPSTATVEPTASAASKIAPASHVAAPERRGVVRAVPPHPPPVVRSRAGAAHTGGIVRETPF